eukprot:gene19077-24903_t
MSFPSVIVIYTCLFSLFLQSLCFSVSIQSRPSIRLSDITNELIIDSISDQLDKSSSSLSNSELIKRYFTHDTSSSQISNVLKSLRIEGQQLLRSIALPKTKDEAWRHSNLKTLFEGPYQHIPSTIPDQRYEEILSDLTDENCKQWLVFVDGVYSQSLSRLNHKSSTSLSITSLKNIKDDEKPSDQLIRELLHIPDAKEETRDSFGSNVLTVMNLAHMEDALLLTISNESNNTDPIQLIFATSGSSNSATYPRVVIRVTEGTSAAIKQSHVSLSDSNIISPFIVNSNTRVIVEKDATLLHTYLQDLNVNGRHLEVISAECFSGSDYKLTCIQSGAKVGRVNVHSTLREPNANFTINGIILAGEKQSLDLHSSILHDTDSANSKQQQRNIIGDKGEAVFKGRIRMPHHAQRSSSEQLCKSLMLGDRARAVVMPTLEIVADNVECSHGAAIADIDENSMFYLASRGIDRQEARRLLLNGFLLSMFEFAIMDTKSTSKLLSKLLSLSPSQNSGVNSDTQRYMSI